MKLQKKPHKTRVEIINIVSSYSNQVKSFTSPVLTVSRSIEEPKFLSLEANNVIISSPSKKEGEVVLLKFKLIDVRVDENLSETPKERGKTLQITEIEDYRKTIVVALFENKTEKDEWRIMLNEAIEKVKQKQMFGVDLKELHRRSGQEIPSFITSCVDVIKEYPDSIMEGVDASIMEHAIDTVNNKGIITDLTAPLSFELLKLFLRQLPTPLFNPLSDFINPSSFNVDTMQSLIRTLPSEYRHLIDVVFEVLNFLLRYNHIKYSPRVLSRTVSSCIGWSKKYTVSSSLFDAVEYVIINYNEIFEDLNDVKDRGVLNALYTDVGMLDSIAGVKSNSFTNEGRRRQPLPDRQMSDDGISVSILLDA